MIDQEITALAREYAEFTDMSPVDKKNISAICECFLKYTLRRYALVEIEAVRKEYEDSYRQYLAAGNARPLRKQYFFGRCFALERLFPDLGKQETKQETNSSKNENTSNYSGNHFADVRKMVDTRLHIAAMVMAGALANKNVTIGCGAFEDNLEYITKTALMYADALIAECEKGGTNA